MKYIVENLTLNSFYNESKGPREFVGIKDATHYKTLEEAMHIVRCYPALSLCVREV